MNFKLCSIYKMTMENIAKTAYEQLKSAGIPCESPFFYRGLEEWIQVGKNGLISIKEKKDDKKFEYLSVYIPKKYVKTIDEIMKNLGIERYVYSRNANSSP